MYVNNLSKVALDCAAAGIEPAISSRKSNALTTTPPSHRQVSPFFNFLELPLTVAQCHPIGIVHFSVNHASMVIGWSILVDLAKPNPPNN